MGDPAYRVLIEVAPSLGKLHRINADSTQARETSVHTTKTAFKPSKKIHI